MTRREQGFTLAEVLVGLSVGALAVLIAAAGVSAASTARRNSLANSVAIEDASAADGLLRRLVARAVPIRIDSPDGAPAYRIEGDPSRLHFIVALWGDPGAAGMWEVSATIGVASARGVIDISGHPFDGAASTAAAPPEDTKLVATETGIGARYAFAAKGSDGSISWQDDWQANRGWPAMISLDPDGDGPAPASVIALPAIAATTAGQAPPTAQGGVTP